MSLLTKKLFQQYHTFMFLEIFSPRATVKSTINAIGAPFVKDTEQNYSSVKTNYAPDNIFCLFWSNSALVLVTLQVISISCEVTTTSLPFFLSWRSASPPIGQHCQLTWSLASDWLSPVMWWESSALIGRGGVSLGAGIAARHSVGWGLMLDLADDRHV